MIENMILVVVGDTCHKDAIDMGRYYFGKKENIKFGIDDIEIAHKEITCNMAKTFYKDVSQEYVFIAFKAPPITGEEKYTLDILAEMLSGGEYSILDKKLKNELGIVRNIFGGYSGSGHVGSFLFYYTCHPNSGEEVLEEIFILIEAIQKGDFDERILPRAKNRLSSQVVFQREKCSSEAFDIGYSYTLGIKDYYLNYLDQINRVNKEDIIKLKSPLLMA